MGSMKKFFINLGNLIVLFFLLVVLLPMLIIGALTPCKRKSK